MFEVDSAKVRPRLFLHSFSNVSKYASSTADRLRATGFEEQHWCRT
jgi:hypothetical protein